MRRLRPVWHVIQLVLLSMAGWMAGEAMALAKDASTPSGGEGGGAWVWGYMVVILVLSLGMIVVCKSSGRRERAKPEVYAEAKPLPKE
jgi:SNF family Na+-dependent transporter